LHHGGFLCHAGLETTALDHEAINDAVEDRAIKKTVPHVLQEILYRFRRFLGIEFEGDDAVIGVQFDHVSSYREVS
jgi:hypothetical protein